MADKTITTVFRGATRKGASVNGNPTWILHTDDGDYTTQSDASLGYEVSNLTHSRLGIVGKRVVLTMTRAGRVWDIKEAHPWREGE